MKNAFISGKAPLAVVVAALFAAENLFAGATVNWVSGGPNPYRSDVSAQGAGYSDGDITFDAEYNTPAGIAVDATGEAIVLADKNNNVIRLLEFSGPESDAGQAFTLGYYSGANLVTNFCDVPVGVALDSYDNVFVLNHGNGTDGSVLEIDYNGGLITNAMNLTNANGIALDSADNIYVTVNSNQLLKITSPGVSSIVATVTQPGALLQGLVVKRAGATAGLVAVCDSARDGIYLINPNTGVVTTNAGFHGQGDFVSASDSAPSNAVTFYQPMGIAESGDGTLIVSDYGNNRVKAILANGSVTNVYGISSNFWGGTYPGFSGGTSGTDSGQSETVLVPDYLAPNACSRLPFGIALAPDGSLYVTEDYYHIIRHVIGANFTAPPPPAPAAPATLTAITNSTGSAVILNWSASVNATNYIIERAQSSGGPYTVIANVGGSTTTYTDSSNLLPGTTYYYVIIASNSGGISGYSPEASVTIPIPPPPAPRIGWFDYEGDFNTGFFSVLHPISGTPYITHNDLNLAIDPTETGLDTYFISGAAPLTNNPSSTNGTAPNFYEDHYAGSLQPQPISTVPDLIIKAVNHNAGGYSSVATAEIWYEVANPQITGNNAAQFTLTDVTTNVSYWYTIDGTTPTNDPNSTSIGPIVSTNGMPVTLSLNGSTNINFQVRAFKSGYSPSGITPQTFLPGAYVPNTLSFGFAYGEASSSFVAAPGQTFYAPVTLSMLPGVSIYSLQFNITVTNSGVGVTNPALVPAGPFSFQSMLMKPDPDDPGLFVPIPPYMFANGETNNLPPSDLVTYEGNIFVNLMVSNGNQLAVGWLERFTKTNLYNTKSQTLITYSLAHDDLFPPGPNNQEPNGVIAGGYAFQIADTNIGRQYQIQLSAASATSDGIGSPGSGVIIATPSATNSASLAGGTLNAIKNVTIGSIPYLVGDVYNFRWFNAGDFGTSNLTLYGSANAEQVFQSAVYGLNTPPPLSDFYDAMDSAGALGVQDNDAASPWFGYLTNAGPTSISNLLSGNITNINQMAFGDGQLDVSDVYVTFLRSEFTNSFLWFQRVWTNGQRVAIATNAGAIISGAFAQPGGKTISSGAVSNSNSITNSPLVNFTAADYLATAGQQISIPITASVFGPYALKSAMLNITVEPLDGSPALTTPISFSSGALGSPTSGFVDSEGNNNYAAAWFPGSASISGSGIIGTLTVTIPANATSQSAYAIHFDHASGSPNGLASFPRHTLTGLITLSARTNSYYSDGIPDSWRLRYFGTIYNYLSVSNADADGTGMNNWQKYIAGLDPTDPGSKLVAGMDQSVAQSRQDSVICWPSVAGKTYVIQRSATLFPPAWISVSTNIGTGSYMEIHDSPASPLRYYRVQVH